jgi:hypothetical protein
MIELAIISAVAVGVLLFPKTASAHCDTPDGPVIIDGKKSLESGDIDLSLKWITAEYEAELKHAFDLCRDVRGLSDNARKVADHHFLETLVRLHRAGEGAPYTGIKPAGSEMSPVIAAADKSMETRSIEKLLPLIEADKRDKLTELFDEAIAKKDYKSSDILAAREYVEAYVHFVKFAAGEDHEEGSEHGSHVHNC